MSNISIAISFTWSVRERERAFLYLCLFLYINVVKPKYLVKVTLLTDVFCTELDIFGESKMIHAKFLFGAPNGVLVTSRQYGIILMIQSNIIKKTR